MGVVPPPPSPATWSSIAAVLPERADDAYSHSVSSESSRNSNPAFVASPTTATVRCRVDRKRPLHRDVGEHADYVQEHHASGSQDPLDAAGHPEHVASPNVPAAAFTVVALYKRAGAMLIGDGERPVRSGDQRTAAVATLELILAVYVAAEQL